MAALSEGDRQLRTKFVPANPALPVTEIIFLSLKYLIFSANNNCRGRVRAIFMKIRGYPARLFFRNKYQVPLPVTLTQNYSG